MRFVISLLLALSIPSPGAGAEPVQTPYEAEQKVVFDLYLDDPGKTGSALFWIRSFLNPLTEAPYGFAPDFMDIKVIVHGTELVTLARKNYERYREEVERMRYYAAFGVEFRVCALAMDDYGYTREDLQDFVKVAPSAITELAHWQQQGYALITPQVLTRHRSIEEIR